MAPFRVLMGIFGLVFGGIGICVLGLIWSSESDFVPVFARLFGSLIACAFVAFGGFMLWSAFAAQKLAAPSISAAADTQSTSPGTYVCPNCGAALGEKAEVSPMGDVKCAHCGRWFNVHKRGA